MKKVLTIAGSDCSGGAGIQADLKTFAAHGVYGMSVIVSVVAENTFRVIDMQDITPDLIEKQIDAVFEDIGVDAVKVGMLSHSCCMEAVERKLREYRPQHVVIDPVMVAKNGCLLMDPNAVETLIHKILPLADVLTPNIPEAEKIAGFQIISTGDMEQAAKCIYELGAKNVLIKGGHATETHWTSCTTVKGSIASVQNASTPKTRTAPDARIPLQLLLTLRWVFRWKRQ